MAQDIILIALILLLLVVFFKPNIKSTFSSGTRADAINSMITQSARWVLASLSDQNPFIANLHANYGVGYIIALRDWASDAEIKEASGVDIFKFSKTVTNAQRQAAQKLISVCPESLPSEHEFLLEVSQRTV